MATEYEFMIIRQRKVGWLAFGGTVMLLLVAISLAVALRGVSIVVAVGAPMLVFMGGFYGLLELAKRHVSEPMRVTVMSQGMRVLNRKAGLENHILFGEIASYQHVVTSEAMGLHLTLKNGQKVQLGTNTALYGDQNFDGMVNQFEEAIALHQQQLGEKSGTLREKSFFERPISTVFMVVLSALLGAAVVYGLITQKPLKASSFTAIAGYISYATAWYNARRQRNS